jgi:thiopeptide-type bacteriocin biosynthesis protein
MIKDFTTSGFFVLRTPLLPFEEFLALSEGLTFHKTLREAGDAAAAAAADHKLLRERLQQLLNRPEIREALWLASPDLFSTLPIWEKQPESDKGQKLEHSLYRYIARMSSRPTPFGLFAACSVGKIGAERCLEVGPRSQYWRRSRLDMEYLSNLADKVSSDPALYGELSYRPNTSLYLAAGRYHHSQGYFADKIRSYRLIATQPTPYLDATLQRAANGATPRALAAALVKDDPDILLEEAQEYIRQLIESQVLVSDLAPPITGPEPVDDMLSQLEHPETSSIKASLSSVSKMLRDLDQSGLGNDLAGYQEIVNQVSQLPAEFKQEHLVQVDMMKPAAKACLDQRLINDILRGVEVLHSLSAFGQQDPFKQFKQDFSERYEAQAVPLTLVLDEEVGIGFERKDAPGAMPEPLIENLDFPGPEEREETKATRQDLILLRKVEQIASEKGSVLELDAKLVEALRAENPPPLPDAFAVMGHVASAGSGSENKYSFYMQSAGGPSGAILLGRFCHADEQLTAGVKEHMRAEEEARRDENVVFAEIAHLPEGRIGNVLFRPILRKYEIPFLATSRVPREQQIPVTDLMVSVENDRVVLRSLRLGCEVVPRLTSAHGYMHGRNLKLYKFLCLLQGQGVAGGNAWNWGILENLAFLPRVTFRNIVFALARWRLDKEAIEKLSAGTGVERLHRIEEWRLARRIPRFVFLSEADNQLLIDFENVLSVETFIEYIRKRDAARLLEMFPDPDRLCAHGPEGSFTHEVVIPFVRQKVQPAKAEPAKAAAPAVVSTGFQRRFLPGSEWLFAKIYASPSQVDRLLLEHVKPLVEKVFAAGEADGWFFIRYGDPHWQLRLRFHGDPRSLSAQVLPQLWQCIEPQSRQGRMWRVQLDSYEREIERYGGEAGMRIAERLFQYDSDLVLQLLASIPDQLGGKVRWHLAFLSTDLLLSGLGMDVSTRRKLANSMGKFGEKNSSGSDRYRKQLSERFRGERQTLESLLEGTADLPPDAAAALTRFAQQMKEIRSDLEQAQQVGNLARPIFELAGSYIHMHLNRIFRSLPNAQEKVIYDFLARTYDSRMARERQALPISQ